ncbi:MAG: 16S rRNA (cytosine(967)-C(5))-methyltransferase RsmB [Ruminococcus sp.]|jgi:16S rRNA (cytosine967-C5)-methyltransferase|nr:16S rRNA (cytosine(967)-C(5))-methyltransferase RsmB [Ruminococcus sp.]
MNSYNPRYIAVKTLLYFFKNNVFSDILLDETLEKTRLDDTSKRFFTRLFYGVIERKITLDFIIEKYSKTPLSKLDPEVKNILRTGIYQLLFLDSVPDNAAVNESVKLCSEFRKTSAKGFVNALLRQFLRDKKCYNIPDGDLNVSLSIRYSVNPDIIASFINDYGYEMTIGILEHFNKPAVNYIKLNNRHYKESDLPEGFAGTDLAEVYSTEKSINTGSEPFKNGVFHIEDYSCLLACKKLSLTGNEDILDVCAAPGGKSFTLSESTSGTVYSCDISEKRVKLIEDGVKRLKLSNIKTLVADGKIYNETFPMFSRILCDVPCSGLGVIAKKPDIRYKRTGDFTRLSDVQYNILSNSTKYLSENGILVYSTCTLRKAENEDVIDRFLKDNPEYKAETETIFPFDHNSDGFFVAVIRKI